MTRYKLITETISPNLTPNPLAALSFAVGAHYGQTRNDSITPYIVHPIRVGGMLRHYYPETPVLEVAGYLHDIVEDCDYDIDYIRKVFGDEVARLVDDVTKYPGRKWTVPTHPDSVRLKAADTFDNLRDFNGNFAQFSSGNRKIFQWWRIYDECWSVIREEPLERLLFSRLTELERLIFDAQGEEHLEDSDKETDSSTD